MSVVWPILGVLTGGGYLLYPLVLKRPGSDTDVKRTAPTFRPSTPPAPSTAHLSLVIRAQDLIGTLQDDCKLLDEAQTDAEAWLIAINAPDADIKTLLMEARSLFGRIVFENRYTQLLTLTEQERVQQWNRDYDQPKEA